MTAMQRVSEYLVVDAPCPVCGHVVMEFVGVLRLDPVMLCTKCNHQFTAISPTDVFQQIFPSDNSGT